MNRQQNPETSSARFGLRVVQAKQTGQSEVGQRPKVFFFVDLSWGNPSLGGGLCTEMPLPVWIIHPWSSSSVSNIQATGEFSEGHVSTWVVATQKRKSDFKSCFHHVEDADDDTLCITARSDSPVMPPKSPLFWIITLVLVYITVAIFFSVIPNLSTLLRLSKANLHEETIYHYDQHEFFEIHPQEERRTRQCRPWLAQSVPHLLGRKLSRPQARTLRTFAHN